MKFTFLKEKMWPFLKSKVFLFNVGGTIVFFIVALILLNVILKLYSRHGESVTVPSIIGMQTDEAIAIIEDNGFKYEIVDTIFDDKYDKGAVVEQNPKPESLVKDGRKIYLIVNSMQDEMISMPQFVGMSMKMVNAMAENYGLAIGSLRYVPDIAVNVVIRQMHDGDEIEPGEKIKKGSTIDLVLGLGISDKTTIVPSLIGKTYKDASGTLLDMFLNTGAVEYDKTVKNKNDSTKAKVYRQSPSGSTINEVNLGYSVDIWLTKDESLLNSASEEENEEEENDDND
jgi:eukaryotic-like serine/threonine-protein kinase